MTEITKSNLKQALDVLTSLKIELDTKSEELAEREKLLEEKRKDLLKRREAIQEEEQALKHKIAFQDFLTTNLDAQLTTSFLTKFNASKETLQNIGLISADATTSLLPITKDKNGNITLHNSKEPHSYQPFAYNLNYLYPIFTLLNELEILDQCTLHFPLNLRPLVIHIKNSKLGIILAPYDPPLDYEPEYEP
ncbi:MAG: hypothetical protein ACFFCI_00625 [Promethearchaeota archaeon]